jgi:hypothetical protein
MIANNSSHHNLKPKYQIDLDSDTKDQAILKNNI